MSDRALSQEEVESLLRASEVSDPSEPAAGRAEARSWPAAEAVVPYNFQRPQPMGKETIGALRCLHEDCGRNFAATLSAMLRSTVEVRLISVDQLTYRQFVYSLESPTCFNLLRAEPLKERLVLEISPAILFPIIDRLLGGGRDEDPPARRPLTEIELRLVARVTKAFREALRRAWANVLELDLSIERVESSPQQVQLVPPGAPVVLTVFELTVGSCRGRLNLCLTGDSIAGVSRELVGNSSATGPPGSQAKRWQAPTVQPGEQSLVELVVNLAESRISTADLIGLRVGDIITTEKEIQSPLHVTVQGVRTLTGSPGALQGRKAIQVRQVLTDKVDEVEDA